MQNRVGESWTAILEPQARFSPSSGVQPLPAGPDAASSSIEDVSALTRFYRHPVAIAILFGLAALPLLLFGIQKPPMMFYDEGYFVPEAKVFIQGAQAPPSRNLLWGNYFYPSASGPPETTHSGGVSRAQCVALLHW